MRTALTRMLLGLVLVMLAMTSLSYAATPPVLTLSDGTNTVTVDSTGTVTLSCTPASACSTTTSNANNGIVKWQGKIGVFSLTASGASKPSLTAPQIDLSLSNVVTTAFGAGTRTLTVSWTDTGFDGLGNATMNESTTFTAIGGGSAVYTSYVDDTNAAFGQGTTVGSLTESKLGSGTLNHSQMFTGPGPTQEPYSMTNVAAVTLKPSTVGYTVDFSLTAPPPPPLTLTCASSAAQENSPYTSMLVANGGVPPYSYSISSGNLPTGLNLDSTTGAITGTPTVSGNFSFTAEAQDTSGNAAKNTVTQSCYIDITPPPVGLICPASTGQVGVAYDSFLVATPGVPPYTFSIISGALPDGLTLNPNTGEISGTPTTAGPSNFTAQVVDFSGGSANTASTSCGITNSPAPSANCAVINAVQGIPITPVTLVGQGGAGGPYTFSASGLPTGLTMSPDGTISGTPMVSGTFSYTVTITDSAGHTGTVNCSVTVNSPPSADCVTINAIQGVPITPVSLVGSGGTGGPYTFTATGLPSGLSMSSDGTISGTPTVTGTFTYTVNVKDKDGNVGTINCSVTVYPPPSASCVTIVAVQGVAITTVTVVGSGGTGGPYTFSATGLPNGLTMAADGTISGTPTVSGTFSYTVTVKDKDGNVGTLNCSVTVNPPPSASCVTIVAVQGVAITPVQVVGSGGTGGPYTFSATGLPNGLTMAADGTISGTPTVSGTFSYTVTVKDKDGNVGTINCSVTVNPPPSASCVTIVAVQGVAITPVTLVGSGGTGGPYTFTATGLPNGLTISSSGTISGTPTVSGTFNYTVTIKDKDGNTGTLNCSVTVNPPPSANCVTIVAVQGIAITPVQVVGSGGNGGPYTFTATGLPNGLTMASDGTISGTPTVNGTFSYTVTVKDKDGNVGTINCSVTVYPPVSANCVSIVAQQGVPIVPVQLVASGGVGGPYTFLATGLPNGLILSTSGLLSGTPTVNGTFNYTVIVKDSAGNIGVVNCSVMVSPPAPPPLTLLCPPGTTGTVGSAYSSGVVVSGGTPPYTFSVVSGSLPPGLTLNTTTGAITGTPTAAGSFTFTIKVVDSLGQTATSQCSGTCASITSVWDFSTPLGLLGTSQNYTANSLTITAYGFTNGGAGTKLYGKQDGGDENGVGLSFYGNSDHEIDTAHYVQLDLQNVINSGATSAQMKVGSVQNGESYNIYGSNTLGNIGTQLAGPLTADDTYFDVPSYGSYRYVSVRAAAKDVLLEAFSVVLPPGCTIVVSPAPLVVSCPASTGKVGQPYSSAIVASGGTSPYTFQIVSGSLPPGLTLNTSTGAITGTPTTAGTFTFTTKVTDSTGGTALTTSKQCTITVTKPPSPPKVSCPPTKTGKVGQSFSTTIPVTGGTAPFTFSISSGSLPPGLTLDSSTGVISGTPTSAGSYSFTIKVIDAAGNIVYSSCDSGCSNVSEKFDFLKECGSFRHTHSYKQDGIDLDAHAFGKDGKWRNLKCIGNGNADDGVGIDGNYNDGIDSNSFVQFDVSNLVSAGATDVQVQVGSTVYGETYNVYGSNHLGEMGDLLLKNVKADGGTVHVPSFPNHKYICIKANYKCVHVKSVTCSNPCQCTITIQPKGCTYTQGGWGSSPSGNNPGAILANNWSKVYGYYGVKIGGWYTDTFTSSTAVQNFLPAGGTPYQLWQSYTNPWNAYSVFHGQVLALQLNVDFSNKGITASGLAGMHLQSGPLAGWTVQQVLTLANSVLGGNLGALPKGMSISDLNNVVDSINNAFDGGNTDTGYLDY